MTRILALLFVVTMLFSCSTQSSKLLNNDTKSIELLKTENEEIKKELSNIKSDLEILKLKFNELTLINDNSTEIKRPNTSSKPIQDNSINYSNKTENEHPVYVQCKATTKKGTRCKRMTKSQNGYCWQHGGN